MSTNPNPCITCGACCATYRVSFYWGETTLAPYGKVPAELTEKISPQRVCMTGTQTANPRCVALQGTVGKDAICTIYENRPSPCRDFEINVDGINPSCDRARARYGLVPIHVVQIDPENGDVEIVA